MAATILTLTCVTAGWADPITIFDFNSVPADGTNTTGSTSPSLGTGTITVIGNVSSGYASGSTGDPATLDDTGLQTMDYPAQGTFNKTAGVQVNVSTVGYSNIVVRWDQQISGTASKYYRFQYCTNGSTFLDLDPPISFNVSGSFKAFTNDLTAVAGVKNNQNFAFRVVSEFESTATSGGLNGYVPSTNTGNYNPSGTVRFDYVVISGAAVFDGNYPPTISSMTNQTIHVNQSTGPVGFTVLDAETPANSLLLNGTSSNPSVVPVSQIAFGGSSQNRSVNVTAGTQTGSSTITVWVTDGGGKSNSASFVVTVLPANTAPLISRIPTTNTLVGVPTAPIPFTIWDAETPSSSLTVSAVSSNTALVPNENFVFGGAGSNRTVSITPGAGASGVAPIGIMVSDGTNQTKTTFALMVTPSPALVFTEPFAYPNGSIVTNSGSLWTNRSGADGDCVISNGQLQVSADLTEDVVAPLIGAPYVKGGGTVLYSSFKVKFFNLPNSNPDYFAHFGSGTSLRDRIYAFIPVGANFGTFRLAIGNASNSMEFPVNLTTNIAYTLVTRYNLDTATSRLWLNPVSESDPSGVTATDATTAANISHYGFRQSSSFDSTVFVDDLKVGLSFAAVTGSVSSPPNPIALTAQQIGNNLRLSWTNSAYSLEAAPVANGPFTNVPSATSPYTNGLTGSVKFFRLNASY